MLSIEVALRLNQPKHYPSRKRDKIHWDLGNSVVVLRWNSLGNSHFALKLGCCYSHQNKMMNSKFSTLTLSSHTPGRDLVCGLKKLFLCQLTQTNQNELLVTIYVFAEYFNLKFMLVNFFSLLCSGQCPSQVLVCSAFHLHWMQHLFKSQVSNCWLFFALLDYNCFKCLSISSQLSLLWSRMCHITYLNFMSLKAARNLNFKRDGIAWSCQFSICSDNPFFLGRSKFHEFDMQPLCKKCYEKMPLELKKRLKKAEQTASRK